MFIGKVHQLTHELLGQRMLNYFESGSIIVWLTSSFTGLVSTYQVNTYVANVYVVSFLRKSTYVVGICVFLCVHTKDYTILS